MFNNFPYYNVKSVRIGSHSPSRIDENDAFTYTFPFSFTQGQSYILSSPTSVNEGDDIDITLITTGLDDGSKVPYFITGVSVEDINLPSLSGEFTVGDDGRSQLSINVLEDFLTEGDEILTLSLGLSNGESDVNVLITDTSVSPTYTLSGPSSVNEGDELYIQINTTNVPIDTQVPYTITGVSSQDIDNVPLTGNFVINSNGESILTSYITEDALTEGDEILTLTLDGIGESIDVTIVHTSKTPSYNLSGPSSVNEGDTLSISLSTQNIG